MQITIGNVNLQEMIERLALQHLLRCLKQFPAVSLLGPRQVGKTTLAKNLCKSEDYFDLENEGDRLKLLHDWDQIIARKSLIVFDEAQTMPELFSRLRGAIDNDRQSNGRFLILGSVSPRLIQSKTQSLAGRIAECFLYPLVCSELPQKPISELWFYGGFPNGGILDKDMYPIWHNSYLQKLLYIDFENWGLKASPKQTERLVKMLAINQGNLWNASQIGKSMGLNYQTINHYVDFLEGAFLVRKLQPYFTNLKKRLIKSPKLYFRDTGHLHALLGIKDYESLFYQPGVGTSWEGFIIENILHILDQKGIIVSPYYFRTNDGYELDLVLDFGFQKLWAIEIKLSSDIRISDMERLKKVSEMIKADKHFLISQINQGTFDGKSGFGNLVEFLKIIENEI